MKKVVCVLIILAALGGILGICQYNIYLIKNEAAEVEEIVDEEVTNPIDLWKDSHPKVRGIYVTGPTAGTDKMNDIIDMINSTELNAIVLDVKDDWGNITFSMDNEMAQSIDACIPYISDIDALMKKLKANDIYVIARIPCFKDPTLAAAKKDLALHADTGEYITDSKGNAWVNPCSKEVWEYNISIALSCCELGFDEIQFDYVRFPVTENSDRAVYGVDLDDAARQSYITGFLTEAVSAIHEKGIPVTADVFGTIIKSDVDSKIVGQDYMTLASTLDVLCPMIYPSHYATGEFGIEVPDANPYDTIYAALEGSKQLLEPLADDESAIIRPWLQAFTADWVEGHIEYDSDAIRRQIRAVYDAGYDEWILWNSASNYNSDYFLSDN